MPGSRISRSPTPNFSEPGRKNRRANPETPNPTPTRPELFIALVGLALFELQRHLVSLYGINILPCVRAAKEIRTSMALVADPYQGPPGGDPGVL